MLREPFMYRRAGSVKIARILIIWGSLAAGVVATILTNNLINDAKQTSVVAAQPQIQAEKVLVVTANVPTGAKLDPATLKWLTWPADGVSANFITESAHPEAIKEFAGHIVGVPIIAGVPLVTTMLHEQKTGGFLSAALPSGLRAYSVKISPETGAGGFILPDDRVDVLLTRKDSGGTSADKITYSSETVLSNIRILAIDQSATDQTNRNDDAPVAIGKTATLALTQRQAEILALAEIQGGISLTLRSLADAHDEVVDQGEALAVRIHRPAETGVSVTRFTVSPDTHKPTGVKIAFH